MENNMSTLASRKNIPLSGWHDVNRVNKSTTRVQIYLLFTGKFVHVEGNHETTTLMIIKHLWPHERIKRGKVQPFAIEELGWPVQRVPDFLVELGDGCLIVIQVKAASFITTEVQGQFEQEREFLEHLGFKYCVWSAKKYLGQPTYTTVRAVERGALLPIDPATSEKVHSYALANRRYGDLLNDFGLDASTVALAQGAAFIKILETLNESFVLYPDFPCFLYTDLFSDRHAPENFWASIADSTN
jgi:hypothetical protein